MRLREDVRSSRRASWCSSSRSAKRSRTAKSDWSVANERELGEVNKIQRKPYRLAYSAGAVGEIDIGESRRDQGEAVLLSWRSLAEWTSNSGRSEGCEGGCEWQTYWRGR